MVGRPGSDCITVSNLTQADAYLDALRRYDIPYLIEGESTFTVAKRSLTSSTYCVCSSTPTIISPYGVLRSPLGGLTDRDVYDLHEAGLFHYLNDAGTAQWSHPRADNVRLLYRRLAFLHQQVRCAAA